MTAPVPSAPAVGDAVVDAGGGPKLRIRMLGPHAAHLALAGPSWRSGRVVRLADPGRLSWDRVAGVWRGPTVDAV